MRRPRVTLPASATAALSLVARRGSRAAAAAAPRVIRWANGAVTSIGATEDDRHARRSPAPPARSAWPVAHAPRLGARCASSTGTRCGVRAILREPRRRVRPGQTTCTAGRRQAADRDDPRRRGFRPQRGLKVGDSIARLRALLSRRAPARAQLVAGERAEPVRRRRRAHGDRARQHAGRQGRPLRPLDRRRRRVGVASRGRERTPARRRAWYFAPVSLAARRVSDGGTASSSPPVTARRHASRECLRRRRKRGLRQ